MSITITLDGKEVPISKPVESEGDLRLVFGTQSVIRKRLVYTIEHTFDSTRHFIAMTPEEEVL